MELLPALIQIMNSCINYSILVFSVIELRNVHFTELALKINPLVETESNLRRIQMFFLDYDIYYRVIAVLLMGFDDQRRCRLSIDRTNWKKWKSSK